MEDPEVTAASSLPLCLQPEVRFWGLLPCVPLTVEAATPVGNVVHVQREEFLQAARPISCAFSSAAL